MPESDNENRATIAAKWKTKLDADEEHFGTVTLGKEFQLRFPMLDSSGAIPPGTTVLWGRTSSLERCTTIVLPFDSAGMTSGANGHNYYPESTVSRLLVGQGYIADPTGAFITEIGFVPHPNKDLHIRQLYEWMQPHKDIAEIRFAPSCGPGKKAFGASDSAFFRPKQEALFDTELHSGAMKITAGIGGKASDERDGRLFESHISFSISFKKPRDMESALDETNKLCTFLSFLTHQYIYPSEFSITAVDGNHFRLLCRAFRTGSVREHTWARNTLILPDDDPTRFQNALTKWYTNNDDMLRGRYLYRNSFEEPNEFSTDRFLAVFQAVEGRISKAGYQFLSPEEFTTVEQALQRALPGSTKLNALLGKIRSNNSESPKFVLKQELPKLFTAAGVEAQFNVEDFVDRIYLRRNKSSHGGSHLDDESPGSLMDDTMLVTAIYMIMECEFLELEAGDVLEKFRRAMRHDLPLRAMVQPTSPQVINQS